MLIKITESSPWAKTPFGEVVETIEISMDRVDRFAKIKRYCRSGYQFGAQLADGRCGLIPISKQSKEDQKILNKIKSSMKNPPYPTAIDSITWGVWNTRILN